MITQPRRKLLAGPAAEGTTILCTGISPEQILGLRGQLDTAGHRARSDVFELRLHRRSASLIAVSQDDAERNGESIPKVIEVNKRRSLSQSPCVRPHGCGWMSDKGPALVVFKRLAKLVLRVHDNRTIPGNGLPD